MSATNDTNAVHLHRVLKATADRVFRAFTDPDAQVKWLPPNGFIAKSHQSDVKVGGSYRMSFKNFSTGNEMFFGGKYVEIVPNEKLVYTDRFEDENLPGEMTTTVTIKEVFCGVDLKITQEGIPSMIPAEACYLGWQESLVLLAKLVETEIPDEG
jgi:uncharacterized protein YndB with AHSA1/START domain